MRGTKYIKTVFFMLGAALMLTACGKKKPVESASDGQIDFEAVWEENPEAFAWIYIPGTGIDYPVLQSAIDDAYYENHLFDGSESEEGCLYTEMANLMNMCDFNTVIHGHSTDAETMFTNLHLYENEDFFENNTVVYLYLPDNMLVYVIFAVYERENDSLIRSYNFTDYTDSERFLTDMYGAADIVREGYEGITPFHYMLTLTTEASDGSGKQFNVSAVLVTDTAGTIQRTVLTP